MSKISQPTLIVQTRSEPEGITADCGHNTTSGRITEMPLMFAQSITSGDIHLQQNTNAQLRQNINSETIICALLFGQVRSTEQPNSVQHRESVRFQVETCTNWIAV